MGTPSHVNNWYDMYLSPSIWMGNNLESDMNEQFIKQAFQHYGEKVVSVKIIKRQQNPYCFVEFEDVEQARHALQKLNGKPIPNTHPPKLFKLNPASFGKEQQLMPEFSLHIGELSTDVDDYQLYCAFAKNYRSVRGAKVVLDANSKSKGFGFVRFSEESDQQRALVEMQHMTGIGRRPIKVGMAAPKRGYGSHGNQSHGYDNSNLGYSSSASYNGSYASPPYHHSNYYSWGGYYHYSHNNHDNHTAPSQQYSGETQAGQVDDMEVLEDPCLEMNVTRENREFMESSESFFEALDRSRWFALDTIQSEVTA